MQLRPYQQEAREAVHKEWENGNSKTLLVLPTGCGKTIVFAKITEDCARSGKRILYSNDGLVFVSYDHANTFYELVK